MTSDHQPAKTLIIRDHDAPALTYFTEFAEQRQIEDWVYAGKGQFACPSCGAVASDTYRYPYCPAGCTEADMLAAPPKCPEAEVAYWHNSRQCLTCQVREDYVRERVRQVKRRSQGGDLPEMVALTALLAEPDEATPFLVDRLWPTGGNVLLAAAAKVGKSTVRNNVLRSLVDGVPLFGEFAVPRPLGKVVLVDLELDRSTLRRWLRRQQIENTDAVEVLTMRGQTHALDPAREEWVDVLHDADVVVMDCLEPLLHARGLNPNTEARKFLEDWTALLTRAGVPSTLVLHHHGHGREGAKGDSGIIAWPDVLWDVVLEDPDSRDLRQPRYFQAFGRDEVDVAATLLELDHATGRLVLVGGTSRETGRALHQIDSSIQTLLLALLADHEHRAAAGEPATNGLSVRWDSQAAVTALGKAAGLARDPARRAVSVLVARGWIVTSPRPRGRGSSGAQMHALSAEGLARAQALRGG